MTRSRADRLCDVLTRNWVGGLMAVYLAVLLTNTLVPFDFSLARLDLSETRLLRITFSRVAWTDIAVNFGMYVPFGFLGAMLARRGGVGTGSASRRTLIAACGVSLATEIVQAFSPTRVSSLVDVATNVFGAATGIVAGVVGGRRLLGLNLPELRQWRAAPHETRARAMVVLLLAIHLMPLSLSLDAERLKTSWRSATWTPFAEYPRDEHIAIVGAEVLAAPDNLVNRTACMELALGDILEFASFALLAGLLQATLRRGYRFESTSAALLTLWMTAALTAVISGLQFTMVARGFHATDVLARMGGAVCGLLVHASRPHRPHARRSPLLQPCAPPTAAMFAGAIALYILIRGAIPFAFDMRAEGLRDAIASADFLPMVAYFRGRFDVALLDLLQKSAMFFLLAAAITCSRRPPFGLARGGLDRRLALATTLCVMLACTVECLQLFMVSRIASLTDPLIALLAAPCGAIAAHQFARLTPSLSDAIDEARPRQPRPATSDGSLTDQLVGQLLDEEPHAPAENAEPPEAFDPKRRS